MKKYKVIRNKRAASPVNVGQTVYEYTSYDYGCASDDTDIHGIEYISVTKEAGKDPFLTIPLEDLDESE